MKILFDEKVARGYDKWYETPKGFLAHRLEKDLVAKIADLKKGMSVLDMGCGTGNYVQFFMDKGMKCTGVDISLPMLRVARKKVGQGIELCIAKAEELPFKDNSVDLVAFITTLEFLEDPLNALQEARRISREGILLGVLNKYSLTGIGRRIRGIFRPSIYNEAKFYTIWELKKLLSKVSPSLHTSWGSVLTLPLSLQQWLERIERILSFRKNPFGAFLVVGVSIK